MATPGDVTTPTLTCEAHGQPTRISCVECGSPVCPKCMVRTEVGTKCERCARPVTPKVVELKRSRTPWLLGALGAVLVVGALVAVVLGNRGGSTKAPPPPAVVGTWTKLPPVGTIRGTTAVVALKNGQVLSAGGGVGNLPLAASEIYDPTAKNWHSAGDMNQARRGADAVLLGNGKVLIAGGVAGSSLLNSAEIFDPATGKWTPTASMSAARLGGTLTLLPNGDVLAAGGTSDSGTEGTGGGQTISPTASAEVYHPASGTWTGVKPMSVPRFEATATSLADGRVLMVGGLGGLGTTSPTGLQYQPLKNAEIFDPAVGAFTGAGSMAEGRALQEAAKLPDGKVLVAGGIGGPGGSVTLSTAERFDPTTGTWSGLAPMAQGRTGASATTLGNGRVLVAGGETVDQGARNSLATSQVFDPAKNAWVPGGSMSCPRSGQGAVLLSDGTVLVVAGDTAFAGQPPVAQGCVDLYTP